MSLSLSSSSRPETELGSSLFLAQCKHHKLASKLNFKAHETHTFANLAAHNHQKTAQLEPDCHERMTTIRYTYRRLNLFRRNLLITGWQLAGNCLAQLLQECLSKTVLSKTVLFKSVFSSTEIGPADWLYLRAGGSVSKCLKVSTSIYKCL